MINISEEAQGEVAIGVVENDGEFLIMRRSEETSSSGYWTFPGGKIEEEETVEEAASREIEEETGLEVEILCTGESYFNRGELGKWKIFPVLMKSSNRDVKMNHEHDKYLWVDLSELENLETLGEMKAPEKLGLEQ